MLQVWLFSPSGTAFPASTQFHIGVTVNFCPTSLVTVAASWLFQWGFFNVRGKADGLINSEVVQAIAVSELKEGKEKDCYSRGSLNPVQLLCLHVSKGSE